MPYHRHTHTPNFQKCSYCTLHSWFALVFFASLITEQALSCTRCPARKLLPFFFSSFPLFSHYAINLIVIIFAIAYWYNSSSILMQIRCRDWPKASMVKCISMPLTNPRPTFNWYSIDTLVHTWSVLDQYNIFCRHAIECRSIYMSWSGFADYWLTVSWVSIKMLIECQLSVGWVLIKMLMECPSRADWGYWWTLNHRCL